MVQILTSHSKQELLCNSKTSAKAERAENKQKALH